MSNTTVITSSEDVALEILRDVRMLIDSPAAWIQGAEARAADGEAVAPESPAATCWCPRGALIRACAARTGSTCNVSKGDSVHGCTCERAWIRLAAHLGVDLEGGIEAWNDVDGREHRQVIAELDALILKWESGALEHAEPPAV